LNYQISGIGKKVYAKLLTVYQSRISNQISTVVFEAKRKIINIYRQLTMIAPPASLHLLTPELVVSVLSPPTMAFSLDLLVSFLLAGAGVDWRRGSRLMAGGRPTEGRSSDAALWGRPERGEKEKAGLNKRGGTKMKISKQTE